MPDVAPAPPSRWGLTWRIVLTVSISALSWSVVAPIQVGDAPWWLLVDVLTGTVTLAVATVGRHRRPLATAVLVNAATAWSSLAGGPATWALFSLATRRRSREIVPASVVAVGAGLVFAAADPTSSSAPAALTVGLILTVVGVTVGWGMYVGSRRELLATLRERAETAEAEQAARVAAARSAERARIAREMHDVLAHRISTVAMHAGVLDYRENLGPDDVRRTAAIIRESSHQALAELRQVLGVLRDDAGDAAPEPPQPDAATLPSLLETARAEGTNVVGEGLDVLDRLPAGLGRTLYRSVQEGLTNARKHAPGTRVTVRLSGTPDEGLTLEVVNPLPVGSVHPTSGGRLPRSGLGLVGLAERAELAGGVLTVVADGRSHTMRMWLPWTT